MEQRRPTVTEIRESAPPSLPLDAVFDVLAHVRRRQLLVVLQQRESAVGLSALARSLAEGTDGSAVDAEQLEVELYHAHVPKLEAAELVSCEDRNTVTLTEQGQTLAAVITP